MRRRSRSIRWRLTAGQTEFSEQQTIVGANVIYPLTQHRRAIRGLRPSLIGAVNGRFLNIKSDAAPLSHAADVRRSSRKGIRLKPSVFDERLRLNYLVDFQQFAASSDSHASFHRWSARPEARSARSTERCRRPGRRTPTVPTSVSSRSDRRDVRRCRTRATAKGPSASACWRPVRRGTPAARCRSIFSRRWADPTSTASGCLARTTTTSFAGRISSRCRRASSIRCGDRSARTCCSSRARSRRKATGSGLGELTHSVAVGLTLRAGGFPLVNLTFAWGGGGHHIIGSIDPSLLGGSSRPSLYQDDHHFCAARARIRFLIASRLNNEKCRRSEFCVIVSGVVCAFIANPSSSARIFAIQHKRSTKSV